MIQSPCIECQERKIGCHEKCFKYIFYRVRLKQEKQRRSEYWHKHGFDPAVSERNRQIREMLRKKGK